MDSRSNLAGQGQSALESMGRQLAIISGKATDHASVALHTAAMATVLSQSARLTAATGGSGVVTVAVGP
jgi:hypothetical protein